MSGHECVWHVFLEMRALIIILAFGKNNGHSPLKTERAFVHP